MKNKKTLLVLSLAFMTLSACGGGGSSSEESTSIVPGATIQLFNGNSRLIGTPKPNPENPSQPLPMTEANIQIGKLPTYRHKDKGDVPYVAVADFAKAIGEAFPNIINPGMTGEMKEGGYYLYSPDKKGEFIFDDVKDLIKVKSGQSFVLPHLAENNGIAGDYCSYRDSSIKDSEKTKVYKDDGSEVPVYDTFSFKDYHFDIVFQGEDCYVPVEAFSKVLFRDFSLDIAYNGADYYSNLSEGSFLASWAYSSKGTFQGLSGIYKPSKNKADNALYCFEMPTKRPSEADPTVMEDYTRFLVLMEGGTAYCSLCKGHELNPSVAISDTETEYAYTWKKVGEALYIDVADNQGPLGTMMVHLDQTRFLSGSISSQLSSYNYDVLRFVFDTIYGLKDIKGYKDAKTFFQNAGVDEGLKSNNPDNYNEAFAKLVRYVDDGHTSYNSITPLTSYDGLDKSGEYTQISRSGPRMTKLVEDNKKYMEGKMTMTKKLDPEGMNPPGETNYYQGIKFSKDKETAIISFNGFANNGDKISNMGELFPADYSIEESEYNIQTRAKLIASTTDGFSQAFKILDIINKTSKIVKNVVVDLTTNGGGEIATMPYLTAFFHDDPTYAIKDVHNGVTREYHYKVDLNGDGKFGDVGDTYKGKFNFYFLTSAFSFSCGNCFPGMAKEGGAKIIGERSGGGTSPVGVYFDALGSFFNISNHYDMCYKVDGKYVQNDAGIPLDHAFPYSEGNWYDPDAVHAFLKTIQ